MDLNEETKIRCFHCHMAFPTRDKSQFEENASINSRRQTNADAGKLNILE